MRNNAKALCFFIFCYFSDSFTTLRYKSPAERADGDCGITISALRRRMAQAYDPRRSKCAMSPRTATTDRQIKKARARQAQSRLSDGSVVFPFFAEFRFQQSDQVYVFDGKIRGQDGHGEEHGAHYDAQRVNEILHSARAEE